MSGMTFASKGGPGPATQTVWFGAIADRINMLLPGNFPTSYLQASGTVVPANFGNLWTPFNSSLGTFTTAPDGTTNVAQLVAEDTSNNEHYVQACTPPSLGVNLQQNYVLGVIRMAAFLKAGTRTRAGFRLRNDFGGPVSVLTVVFDLAGGQIGVPAAIAGSQSNLITLQGTQIIAYPNGWYLCIQDAFWIYYAAGIVAEIFLDAGSGTGALNNVYAGNPGGTTGAYVWRTNLLPLPAWGINTPWFLDDFNSISTIDVNNTKAPGFNWYPGHDFRNFNYTTSPPTSPPAAFPAGQISVASSILTLTGPTDGSDISLSSVAQTNALAGTFVGNWFGAGKPAFYELKMAWDYTTHNPLPNKTNGWWCTGFGSPGNASVGGLVAYGMLPDGQPDLIPGREIDILEGSGSQAYANPDSDFILYTPSQSSRGGIQGAWGYPQWLSTFQYNATGGGGDSVIHSGLAYSSTSAAGNLNQVPPNATFWTPQTYPTTVQPITVVDFTQMQLYQMLVIPFWGNGAQGKLAQQPTYYLNGSVNGNQSSLCDKPVGLKLQFFNGALLAVNHMWGPNISDGGSTAQNTYAFNSDAQGLAMFLNSSQNSGNQIFIDYFKVMQ